MNPAHLLAHFDRISEAPDAVPRLGRFILDLAVRGKLVEQDPNEEPASEMLRRMRAEKAGVSPGMPSSGDLAIPFETPSSWQWVQLGDVLSKLTDGTHHSPPNHPDGPFKYITAKNIKPEGVALDDISYVTADVHREIYTRCNPEPGDLLYIKDGATTGVVTVNNLDEPFSMLSSVALLKPSRHVFNRLLVAFLRSPFFYSQMRAQMKGAAITRVTLKRMAPALVPLPPLAEQHRIVAKVDELMALCDRLEAAQTERETRRDRVVAASLSRLDEPAADDGQPFRDHAGFHLRHLPRLTARPQHVQQLRQAILNLAVRGSLTADWRRQQAKTDDASRIVAKLDSAHAAVGGLRQGNAAAATEGAHDLDVAGLPLTWRATELRAAVCPDRPITYGILMPGPDTPDGVPYVRVADFPNDRLNLETIRKTTKEIEERYARARLRPGDILVSIRGTVGRVCVVPKELEGANITQDTARLTVQDCLSREFVVWCLRAPVTQDRMRRCAKGVAVRGINIGDVRALQLPVPSLAEQHRIVAKVDELMALCDRLEAQLTTAQAESRCLLEALLHQALAAVA